MNGPVNIFRQKIGIGIIAFVTIMLELILIRVFDVILDPSIGYMVVTIAMFSLGLGGIYTYIFRTEKMQVERSLPALTVVYGLCTVLVLFLLNGLPFSLDFKGGLLVQLFAWLGMYLSILTPFFISGIMLSILFMTGSEESHGLYFFDLLGAGLGCLLLMPLIPVYGPGGLLFFLAGMLCLAAFCFSSLAIKRIVFVLPCALVLVAYPIFRDHYLEFSGHINKRGTDDWKNSGQREYVKWDPVSKLEVFAVSKDTKYFSLDGGQQASWMVRFNGDLSPFLQEMEQEPQQYYFGLNSLVHYLKRSTAPDTLVLGAAVGREPLAALVFGARHVDAIEMVGAMVDAAQHQYAQFSGNLFNHPQVSYQKGEARTFLRATEKKYDIIQMFSNHTSSSIAQGSGALGAVYLQTVEAYEEYFSHLKEDGILSMNRHFYPRMLTTAALAWSRRGGTDFHRHVLVFERYAQDTLPTVLIKMSPWTPEEVESARDYLNRELIDQDRKQTIFGASPAILRQHPYAGGFISRQDRIEELSPLLGTHGQKSLAYPITLRLRVEGLAEERTVQIDGGSVHDNRPATFVLPTPLEGMRGRHIYVELSSENEDPDQAFSVWLDRDKQPILPAGTIGGYNAYRIAFNPCAPEDNMLPGALFAQPFPAALAAQAEYRLSPVEDDRPFFNMIRKNTRELVTGRSTFLDGGTANVLNAQLLPFLSRDIVSFFVVGGVSVLFAVLFIFVPLRWTPKGAGSWPGMGWFLVYFSCLGAGFIVIELTLIQLCIKLIGYPTFTFACVLFSLLCAAALGSLVSKKMGLNKPGRWPWIFIGLIAYGLIFLWSHQALFAHLLQYSLPLRCLSAALCIFPLGFFLGMPFPLGMTTLGRHYPQGIPWAWGMNGFFTVLGGFLSLISAFFLGFKLTVLIALGVYCLALLAYKKMSTACTRAA